MYSYSDRLRAVELYFKLGKRIKATIRQLGYPTKNALKGWCREYEQQLTLRVRCVARPPKYSEAEKLTALEHYRTHDRCIASTMRALGYPGRATLTAWVREAFPHARTSMVGRSWRHAYPDATKYAGVIGLCNGEEEHKRSQILGVCRPTLCNWKNQLLGHEAPSAMKHRNTSPPEPEHEIEALQSNIRQLQLEHDLLKKANELLKKGLGVDLHLLSNREKTQLFDALKDIHRLRSCLPSWGLRAAPTSTTMPV